MESAGNVTMASIHRVTSGPYNFEPHIAVNPTNPNHLAAIAIKTSKFNCLLRPRGQCEIRLILYESHDGGQSWDEMQLTEEGWGFDGMVAFGPSGDLYATGLQTPGIFVHKGGTREGIAPANHWLIELSASDKPWLSIDQRNGDLYLVYSHGANLVLRSSRDGGQTWSEPTVVVKGPELFKDDKPVEVPPWGGQVLFGDEQDLAVTWLWSPAMGMNTRLEGGIWTATSSDRGATFSDAQFIGPSHGAPSAVSYLGTYYVFYAEGTLEEQHLTVAISNDGGRTWSKRVASGDLTLYAALNPAPGVNIAPGGIIDVVFYNPSSPDCFDVERRLRLDRSSGEQFVDTCFYDVFHVYSTNRGDSWSKSRRVNEKPIDGREFLRMQNASRPGEYIGMASTDDCAYPIWIEGVHAYTRRIAR